MQVSLYSELYSRFGTSSLGQKLSQLRNLSTRAKLIIAFSAVLSLTLLAAGFELRKRRRRYRAISPSDGATSSHTTNPSRRPRHINAHRRVDSFPSPIPDIVVDNEDGRGERRPSVDPSTWEFDSLNTPTNDQDLYLSLSQNNSAAMLSDEYYDADTEGVLSVPSNKDNYLHDSDSDDSFVSAVEAPPDNNDTELLYAKHTLYTEALKLVDRGEVACRILRTKELHCESKRDFLAKLHCVREAFHQLLKSESIRRYVSDSGCGMMVSLLKASHQDPAPFIERYNDIVSFCEDPNNWEGAAEELRARGVVCLNVYDVALDFLLLDAFDDLSSPPAGVLNITKSGWIPLAAKQGMLNAAVWSILKAKRNFLTTKTGFMARFYNLSEIIAPTFAWGFLGTDEALNIECNRFKSTMEGFLRTIFSLDSVRYSTVEALADDIMYHSRRTFQSLTDS